MALPLPSVWDQLVRQRAQIHPPAARPGSPIAALGVLENQPGGSAICCMIRSVSPRILMIFW